VAEKHPKHNRKSLISSPKLTTNYVQKVPKLLQNIKSSQSFEVFTYEGTWVKAKSERVLWQQSLHTADGSTGYLFSPTVLSIQRNLMNVSYQRRFKIVNLENEIFMLN